jgi:hypothetical protein
MSVDNSGPAFPFEHGHSPDAANVRETGMTLRDWFAGQALAGLMAAPDLRPQDIPEFTHMATRLYQVADAMLRERSS